MLRESDKMRGLSSIVLSFYNEFNEFNHAGAQMLDFISHKTQKYFEIPLLAWKRSDFVTKHANH